MLDLFERRVGDNIEDAAFGIKLVQSCICRCLRPGLKVDCLAFDRVDFGVDREAYFQKLLADPLYFSGLDFILPLMRLRFQ
jgi:hypothetical protein